MGLDTWIMAPFVYICKDLRYFSILSLTKMKVIALEREFLLVVLFDNNNI